MERGYRISSVGDSEAARQYLRDVMPDLVLLDLYLNGFEGFDILHDIKSMYPHLPVLIMIAYDNYADDPRLSEADGYVVKCFNNFDYFKHKVVEVLKE